MFLWTSSFIVVLLLQTVPSQTQQPQVQQANTDNEPVIVEEAAKPTEELPRRLPFTRRDWDLTQAYFDVFSILSNENSCSRFYGGPLAATTVLNEFAPLIRSEQLLREVSFQMVGRPRMIRNAATGTVYRLFEKARVNESGAFYQRRADPMRKFPADVGEFPPGTRAARALIFLHELGHLVLGENGDWLLADDGHNGDQSKENTLRVQRVCRAQLNALQ